MAKQTDRITLPPGGRAEDQHDLPFLHRRLRLPRVQVARRTGGRPRAKPERARPRLPQAGAAAGDDADPGDDQRGHDERRQPAQHHDRAGQGLRREQRPVVDARRQDGLVHVRARRHHAGASEAPDAVRGRPVARDQLGQRTGDLRRPDEDACSTRTGRAASCSPPSITAAPAAASRTPGAAAS